MVLRHRMEDWRLPANAGLLHRCPRIDIGAALQQQPDGLNIAILGRYVQQCSSLEREVASAGGPKVEFRKTSVRQRRIGIKVFAEKVDPAAEQMQQRRD